MAGIVLVRNLAYLADALRGYDLDTDDARFTVVTDAASLASALAMPVDTLWCVVGPLDAYGDGMRQSLQQHLGAPARLADVVNMEFANTVPYAYRSNKQ